MTTAKKRRVARVSDYADAFLRFMRSHGVDSFARDYVAIPGRRWKIDLAHVEKKIAVEIHGGTYARGRHSRHEGMQSDLEKERALVAAGWRCIAFTGEEIKRRPIACLENILSILGDGHARV